MQKRRAKRVGLTGGIASGKSLVSQLFHLLGIPIYSSDLRAKELILENEEVRTAIIKEFGSQSYLADGSYNVPYISSIVFADKNRLASLNQIVHPAVFKDQELWLEGVSAPYAIIESALLFEAKATHLYDEIIVVAAEDELRLQRIMRRDKISEDEAQKRIDNQMLQKLKVDAADYVIWNNETKSVIQQVMEVHQEIIASLDRL